MHAFPDSIARDAARGDRDAFRRLVERESRALLAVARRYTGDWDAAADAVQETWLKVHARLGDYDPSRPFGPWLRTIHRRVCLDLLRREASRPERAVAPETLPEPPDPADDPLDDLDAARLRERVRRAVAALPDRQRAVVAAVDLEQADPAETAARLGMSWATLRTTLHFARKRLAERLRRLEVDA